MEKKGITIIYWRTLRGPKVESPNIHVVWEDRHGRTFGKIFFVPIHARHYSRFAYQHLESLGAYDPYAQTLSNGCQDARRFLRDMPRNSKRLPCFRSDHSGLHPSDKYALLAYIKNQLRRHPEMRKPGYLWKCDE